MTEMLADRAAAAVASPWAIRARHPLLSRRWKEVAQAEEEIAKREQRLSEADVALGQARARLTAIEQEDIAKLSEWQAGGSHGPRPAAGALEAKAVVDEAHRTFEDRVASVEAAERERADVIERQRKLIVADAETLLSERAARARQLIEELRGARAALVDAAGYRLWAMVFPAEELNAMPHFQALGAALAASARTIGIPPQQLQYDRILDALEQDVSIVSEVISPQQRAVLVQRGEMPSRDDKEAAWFDPDHERSHRTARLEELAQRAAEHLGVPRERLTEEMFDNFCAALEAGEV